MHLSACKRKLRAARRKGALNAVCISSSTCFVLETWNSHLAAQYALDEESSN
jgi:hypothetical protein